MHCGLYVCLHRSEARTSLQARKKVYQYLCDEGFTPQRRFGGYADYFSVSGRGDANLTLLRLRHQNPRKFAQFWRQLDETFSPKKKVAIFRKTYPDFAGEIPVGRSDEVAFGYPDDAQIMDEALFEELKRGFSEEITYACHGDTPNVIFTDDPDDSFVWPKTAAAAAEFWVVAIHYHE